MATSTKAPARPKRPKKPATKAAVRQEYIKIRGASEHNLRNVSLDIPKNKLIVFTGVSGSGKSSLAFDTLYAEGHRRYVESLSTYARQFMEQLEKPDVESIHGLAPAIAIDQKSTSKNPRSTVGTVTEIYDFLRLLFARAGLPHCPHCGRAVASQSVDQMTERLLALSPGTPLHVLAPVVQGRKGVYRRELQKLYETGFVRARIDGQWHDLGVDIKLDRAKLHDIDILIDSIVVKDGVEKRLKDSIALSLRLASSAVMVHLPNTQEDIVFSPSLSCTRCGIDLPEMSPRLFSFNSPRGYCESCKGLGVRYEADPSALSPDDKKHLSIKAGALPLWGDKPSAWFLREMRAALKPLKLTIDTPLEKYSKRNLKFLFEGSPKWPEDEDAFEGLCQRVERWFEESDPEAARGSHKTLLRYMKEADCRACSGTRLSPVSCAVTVGGETLPDLVSLDVEAMAKRFPRMLSKLRGKDAAVAERVGKEITERVGFLLNVGLGYLSLDRRASTLSGGESQRIRLATQVGCRLRGVLYVLDEPTIGLHVRDSLRLIDTLKAMRDLGNTVLVVEHDETTIRSADHLVDLGPGAGVHGGEITAQGTFEEILKSGCLTADYLSGKKSIPLPKRKKAGKEKIVIEGAKENNLNIVKAEIPIGLLTVVTGVSGAGKSSLIDDILYRAAARELHGALRPPGKHKKISGLEHLKRVVEVDQSPLGRTPRSNPATYTGIYTPIRTLFSLVPEARMRGFGKGRFSFNVKGGRCEECKGMGRRRIEMNFMPDRFVHCTTCNGQGFNRETLDIRFKGRNIAEILAMTIEEAAEFFKNIPPIQPMLKTLCDVGLGYLKLGQNSVTLSGGEAQRVKLAAELGKSAHGSSLYLLDEPTIGLHFEDVRRLVEILLTLRDKGHTVVLIEHNPDIIKCADHLLDLGPEGGKGGGKLVASGPPEKVAKVKASHTGQLLKQLLGQIGS